MKCNTCGAPVLPGVTICEYCGNALEFDGANPGPVGAQSSGPSPQMAPAGASAAPGAAAQAAAMGGGVTRALAPDGCWYPVAASQVPGGKYLVRFNDGRQATLPEGEIRPPCNAGSLNPGVRVFGEYEGRYYPGTVMESSAGGWNVRFDDGETATCNADQICLSTVPAQQVTPGTQVLCQSKQDGCWYPGRVISGTDQNGRQRVRIDSGGEEVCTPEQMNPPAGADLLQQNTRVMGIGPDGLWYPGTVQQCAQGQCYIRFDDNEEAWVMAHEVRFIC